MENHTWNCLQKTDSIAIKTEVLWLLNNRYIFCREYFINAKKVFRAFIYMIHTQLNIYEFSNNQKNLRNSNTQKFPKYNLFCEHVAPRMRHFHRICRVPHSCDLVEVNTTESQKPLERTYIIRKLRRNVKKRSE